MSEEKRVPEIGPNDCEIVKCVKIHQIMVARVREVCPDVSDAEAEQLAWDWYARSTVISRQINSAMDDLMPIVTKTYFPFALRMGPVERVVWADVKQPEEQAVAA